MTTVDELYERAIARPIPLPPSAAPVQANKAAAKPTKVSKKTVKVKTTPKAASGR